jgi:hypothetical protein
MMAVATDAWSACAPPAGTRPLSFAVFESSRHRSRASAAPRSCNPVFEMQHATANTHQRDGQRDAADGLNTTSKSKPPTTSCNAMTTDAELTSLDQGRTNYGDRDFARFLRRSFARSMGISTDLLNRPIIGIAMSLLHVSPEAAVGGPPAVVRNGDRIAVSVADKRVDLLVDASEIERRLATWSPPTAPTRGCGALYRRSVLQAQV